MYTLGDVPLILQGAGQRESNLTPQQQQTLAKGMAYGSLPSVLRPDATGKLFGLPPLVVYGALGLVAAMLIANMRGGRG